MRRILVERARRRGRVRHGGDRQRVDLEDGLLAANEIHEDLLELVESLLINTDTSVGTVLENIRAQGVKIAIDDFGTGYSSLSYLSRFNASCLKIDRAFIENNLETDRDTAILAAIVQLGHSLDMVVVAEGIETEESMAQLTRLNCDHGQGYYWSHPLGRSDFLKLLAEQDSTITRPERGGLFSVSA